MACTQSRLPCSVACAHQRTPHVHRTLTIAQQLLRLRLLYEVTSYVCALANSVCGAPHTCTGSTNVDFAAKASRKGINVYLKKKSNTNADLTPYSPYMQQNRRMFETVFNRRGFKAQLSKSQTECEHAYRTNLLC